MEIKDLGWPRLSGELWYGVPKYWTVVEDEGGIKILPAATPRGVIVFLVVLAVIVVVGGQIARPWVVNHSDQVCLTIGSIGVALAELVGATFLKVTFEREQARGPILLISFDNKEVNLPRESKTWSFEQVVRWEIIYGCRIRDRFHRSRMILSYISELQVVVANCEHEQGAWPIVGAYMANDPPMQEVARSAAKTTNTPLFLLTANSSRLIWSPPSEREEWSSECPE